MAVIPAHLQVWKLQCITVQAQATMERRKS